MQQKFNLGPGDAVIPIAREAVEAMAIDQQFLQGEDAFWDEEWQCYWVKKPSKCYTWLALLGVESRGYITHPNNR
jgi:hypothetical protein